MRFYRSAIAGVVTLAGIGCLGGIKNEIAKTNEQLVKTNAQLDDLTYEAKLANGQHARIEKVMGNVLIEGRGAKKAAEKTANDADANSKALDSTIKTESGVINKALAEIRNDMKLWTSPPPPVPAVVPPVIQTPTSPAIPAASAAAVPDPAIVAEIDARALSDARTQKIQSWTEQQKASMEYEKTVRRRYFGKDDAVLKHLEKIEKDLEYLKKKPKPISGPQVQPIRLRTPTVYTYDRRTPGYMGRYVNQHTRDPVEMTGWPTH